MDYNKLRKSYQPKHIKVLLISESPPPAADIESSRHFYRADRVRSNDRLFTNTIQAIYPAPGSASDIEQNKEHWLQQLKNGGYFMTEALNTSLPHETTKEQRQKLIHNNLFNLIEHLRELTDMNTKIILIKSNVFEVAAKPLAQAGFNILNTKLVDYPGQYNQRAYREKLSALLHTII